MEGKILHSAYVNKARDTIHNEESYWTLEEIRRMSYWLNRRRYAALRSWNVNFLLGKSRTERMG
jgi:hypothetical protein